MTLLNRSRTPEGPRQVGAYGASKFSMTSAINMSFRIYFGICYRSRTKFGMTFTIICHSELVSESIPYFVIPHLMRNLTDPDKSG